MYTRLRIDVPKRFYEDKPSITPGELMGMILEFMTKVEKVEETLIYELETEFKAMNENVELKEHIKHLEKKIKKQRGTNK